MSYLEELKKKLEVVDKEFKEFNAKENLIPRELRDMSVLAVEVKKLRSELAFANENPQTFLVKNLIKERKLNELNNVQTLVEEKLVELSEKERNAFFPSLSVKDYSAHELQRQSVERWMEKVTKNGMNGINRYFDEIERAENMGRIDFVTLSIESLKEFFDENQIPLNHSNSIRFVNIENDFLSKADRLKIQTELNDLYKAKAMIDEYNL